MHGHNTVAWCDVWCHTRVGSHVVDTLIGVRHIVLCGALPHTVVSGVVWQRVMVAVCVGVVIRYYHLLRLVGGRYSLD